MNSFFKTIIAGYGAKKLGGGCFSTIIIFILIYVALVQCNKTRAELLELNKPKQSVSFNYNPHKLEKDSYYK
jgi:hypothetical protein